MRYRKITLDSRPVFRKRRIHMACEVSDRNDEFSCEGEAEIVGKKKQLRDVLQEVDDLIAGKRTSASVSQTYGVSKQEFLVSDHFTINGMRSCVGI